MIVYKQVNYDIIDSGVYAYNKIRAVFFSSHEVRLFLNKYHEHKFTGFDELEYAGKLTNLKDVEDLANNKVLKINIC